MMTKFHFPSIQNSSNKNSVAWVRERTIYRPSDCSLSVKSVPAFAAPYGRIPHSRPTTQKIW
jgi:hypothetical protein